MTPQEIAEITNIIIEIIDSKMDEIVQRVTDKILLGGTTMLGTGTPTQGFVQCPQVTEIIIRCGTPQSVHSLSLPCVPKGVVCPPSFLPEFGDLKPEDQTLFRQIMAAKGMTKKEELCDLIEKEIRNNLANDEMKRLAEKLGIM